MFHSKSVYVCYLLATLHYFSASHAALSIKYVFVHFSIETTQLIEILQNIQKYYMQKETVKNDIC